MNAVHAKAKVNLGSFNLAKGLGILFVILSHTFAHLDWEQSVGLQVMNTVIMSSKAGLMPMFS